MISNTKTLASLMLLTAATGAQATVTTHASESFESRAVTDAISAFTAGDVTWSGYGAVTNLTYTYAGSATGFPISGDTAHTKYLNVNGELTLTQGTAITDDALVDLMVQATLPCEALALPDTATSTAQMAVGVDLVSDDSTKASIKVWCKAKGASAASWVELKQVDAESWHRVSFLCDYTNKRCQIRLDGEPCVTASGYQTASTTDTTANGAWYPMALDGTSLAGVQVLGLTAVDDMLVTSGAEAATNYSIAGQDSAGVDYSWYDQYGLAWNPEATYESESGLTAAQKFATGLDPFSTDKFKITAMTMGSKTTFTVPAATKAKLVHSTTADFKEKTTVDVSGTSVEVDTTTDDVRYFRLESSNGNVVGDNTCGWVKVTSTLENTVIGVPWTAVGTGEAIKVANLVKTDNLTAGDMLYVYISGTWYAYILENNAWTATQTAGTTGLTIAAAPTDQSLARGAALFLQRQNPVDDKNAAVPFYVYGQYASTAATTAITAGTTEAPTYTLCASPNPAAFDLNAEGKFSTTPNAADRIIVPLANGASLNYQYKNGQWGYDKTASVTVEIGGESQTVQQSTWTAAETIPLGQGFWYVSQGGSPTINW